MHQALLAKSECSSFISALSITGTITCWVPEPFISVLASRQPSSRRVGVSHRRHTRGGQRFRQRSKIPPCLTCTWNHYVVQRDRRRYNTKYQSIIPQSTTGFDLESALSFFEHHNRCPKSAIILDFLKGFATTILCKLLVLLFYINICENLEVWQSYWPPQPVTGIVLALYLR